MATEILVKNGTPIVWADTTDYAAAGSGYSRTHQLDLTGVLTTEAREGAKADLGATRAARYGVRVGMEVDVAPVAGTTIDFYWSASASATAGTGNDGGATGADADYKNGEEAEWVKQLVYLGSLELTADADPVVQRCSLPDFVPSERYGMPVVVSNAGQTLMADADEMYVALIPLIDESQ